MVYLILKWDFNGGLMEREVHSMADYFKILEELGTENYIFRGQNNPYYGITASGFRPYLGGFSTNKIYDLKKITKDFTNKIIRKLSSEEKEHIYAFSQHHGIPTNLIDFTYSPLIGLFFSCYGNETIKFTTEELVKLNPYEFVEKLEEDKNIKEILIHNLSNKISKKTLTQHTEIYLISKNKLIDISYFAVKEKETNLFVLLKKEKFMEFLIKEIDQKIENMGLIKSWLINLIDNYENNNLNFFGSKEHYFYEDENNNKNNALSEFRELIRNGEIKTLDKVLNKLLEYILENIPFKQIIKWDIINPEKQYYFSTSFTAAKCYSLLLFNLFYLAENSYEACNLKLDFHCLYQPPEIFDRIINQKGLFLSQFYSLNRDSVYTYNHLTKEKIIPDITIKIFNSKKILKELKILGIDSGFIFNDIDNIARSIVKDHTDKLNK